MQHHKLSPGGNLALDHPGMGTSPGKLLQGACATLPANWRGIQDRKALLCSVKEQQLSAPASVGSGRYELWLWLQHQETEILSRRCEERAPSMFRASNLPSSCMQSPAMVQSTCIIYLSRIFAEKRQGSKQKRCGMVEGGMPPLLLSPCWFLRTVSSYSTSFIAEASLAYDVQKTLSKLSEGWTRPMQLSPIHFAAMLTPNKHHLTSTWLLMP